MSEAPCRGASVFWSSLRPWMRLGVGVAGQEVERVRGCEGDKVRACEGFGFTI